MRPLVTLCKIKFPVQWIVVTGAGKCHGLCPGIGALEAKPLYGPHAELNLHRMEVIPAEVSIEGRRVELGIGSQVVFGEAARRNIPGCDDVEARCSSNRIHCGV